MNTPEERQRLEDRAIIANARLIASEWKQRLPERLAKQLHELESPPGARPTTCAVCRRHRSDELHLKHRGVYEIRSRNLLVGAFDAYNGMFYGIREKMGSVYVDAEQNVNTSGHGTAFPIRVLTGYVPEHIELRSNLAPTCTGCDRDVRFDEALRDTEPGGWRHVHTGDGLCPEGTVIARRNEVLFDLLKGHHDRVEARLIEEQEAAAAVPDSPGQEPSGG